MNTDPFESFRGEDDFDDLEFSQKLPRKKKRKGARRAISSDYFEEYDLEDISWTDVRRQQRSSHSHREKRGRR